MNKNNEAIKDYFNNEDIRSQIREMTNEEMVRTLKELEGTRFWFAILKYNIDRISVIQDSFLTLDPVKEPSKISQYQGTITGMLDLQDAVLSLKFQSKEEENPRRKEEKAKEDLGGAYNRY